MALFDKLVATAEELVELTKSLKSNTACERSGGVLTWGIDNLSYRRSILIGTVDDPNMLEKYRRFSEEKAVRLYSDWLRNPKTAVSSWQSRNRDADKYGGAVLFGEDGNTTESGEIISFSGLKEEFDEAVSLVLGDSLGILVPSRRERVLNISDSDFAYNELMAAYQINI